MHNEKFQLNQIQNGRLSAIILFNMPSRPGYLANCARQLDHYAIKQNVPFQEGLCPKNFKLDLMQNGRLSTII